MDLNHLRTFLHVAELGSLSRAAKRLHLSQPALSRQIQGLEQELKTALFTRTGRGMRITEAGTRLAARGRPLLLELDQLAEDARSQSGVVRGHVSLAVPPSFGASHIGALVEAFTKAYPEVKLRVVVALGGAVREGLLQQGSIDLGVVYGPIDARNLHTHALWEEALVLLSRPDQRPVARGPLPFRRLQGLPLILPTGTHGLRSVLERHSEALGYALRSAIDVDSLQVNLELVRRGLGHAVLPRRAAADDLKAGTLVATPIQRPTPRRTALLAYAADRPQSRAGQVLADLVRSRFGEGRGVARE